VHVMGWDDMYPVRMSKVGFHSISAVATDIVINKQYCKSCILLVVYIICTGEPSKVSSQILQYILLPDFRLRINVLRKVTLNKMLINSGSIQILMLICIGKKCKVTGKYMEGV
jgi:hypothetical protein